MTKRGKIGQTRHDAKVASELARLKDEGFSVKADLPGRARPPKIGGTIPDIVAKKGDQLIVEEIETKATVNSDKKQQEKLRTGTKKLGGKFNVKVAK